MGGHHVVSRVSIREVIEASDHCIFIESAAFHVPFHLLWWHAKVYGILLAATFYCQDQDGHSFVIKNGQKRFLQMPL
jgi:hypothetical protein